MRLGVLALGPRRVPSWQCGPRDQPQHAPATGVEVLPFDVVRLRDELEKLGCVEDLPATRGRPGRHFVLEVRMGDREAVTRFAQQFAQERVDLIFAITTLPAHAAQEATRAKPVPIVFTAVSDPVGEGFAHSPARPGGPLTGVSTQLVQGSGKRVELLKEMAPGLRCLLILYQADFRPAQQSVAEMRKAARGLGIARPEHHVSSRKDVKAVFAEFRRERADGIMLPADPVAVSKADVVLESSLRQRVPVFGLLDFLADWGALAAYGPSLYQSGRRVAHYVDRITKRTRPGDLAVEALDPVFVINLKAAACLGVSVPATVLYQADRVIR